VIIITRSSPTDLVDAEHGVGILDVILQAFSGGVSGPKAP
jgi:hypothetical protein